jgi:N-acetylglucosaminyldiphosphoundecaprenol N-acetyl-beta-D-mannosaminyltransferase
MSLKPDVDSEVIDVLGLPVSARSLDSAVELIGTWIALGSREYVCVTGTHGVVESQRDPDLAGIHQRAGLVVPDGMPMVWSGHWAGAAGVKRIRGADLMVRVLQEAQERGWSTFFYGGTSGTLERLEQTLRVRFPQLDISGSYSPPFRPLTDEEADEVERLISAADPTIIWVGLSTPKQERWMDSFRGRVNAPVMLGVGAAFDMINGDLRQAPKWIQNSGFEWVYRLYLEPRRLWRRYARIIPTFVVKIVRHPPKMVPPAARPLVVDDTT